MSNSDHPNRVIRIDFDFACRAQFIDKCYDLINAAERYYADHPGLTDYDIALLNLDIPPSMKFERLARFLPEDDGAPVPLALRLAERNRVAGVIVHERLRQARAWLGYYETFNGVASKEEVGSLPMLNVRREIQPVLYDRMMQCRYPVHVACALDISDDAFLMVKGRDKHLRAVCGQ